MRGILGTSNMDNNNNSKKVLISAVGFFGSLSLVETLKKSGYEVLGTDMNENSAARFYCDKFYVVPPGRSEYFIPDLFKICKEEKVDFIIPGSSFEVYALALNRDNFKKIGTTVLVSAPEIIDISTNKYKTYCKLSGLIALPKYFYSSMGFCEKPMEGKGGRGVKIIQNKTSFVMEKLEGEEVDVDVLSYKGEVLLTIMKVRQRAYGGTLVEGKIVNYPYLEEQVKKIIKEIPVDYLSVIQFIGGKLLEINPRIAGAMYYPDDWNMPDLALKLASGELTPEQIKEYQSRVPYGKHISKTLIQYQY